MRINHKQQTFCETSESSWVSSACSEEESEWKLHLQRWRLGNVQLCSYVHFARIKYSYNASFEYVALSQLHIGLHTTLNTRKIWTDMVVLVKTVLKWPEGWICKIFASLQLAVCVVLAHCCTIFLGHLGINIEIQIQISKYQYKRDHLVGQSTSVVLKQRPRFALK